MRARPDVAAPRVTLGVPVYNGERYLAETLDSLLAQDFMDFELIISDNASTDGTRDVCETYLAKDARIHYVRNQRNIGAAANYNRLVGLARSPYFKWASADDVCGSTLLSRCVEVLDRDAGVVLAYPRTVLIDESGDPIRDHPDRLHMPHVQPWKRLRHFATHRWLCNPCFGLIRTEVLRRTRLVRPNVHSDVTLLGELTIAGCFHEVPEPLFFRRVTATSCGLGKLNAAQVAAWFAPDYRRLIRLPPRLLVFLQIEKAILDASLPVSERLRCMWAFGEASLRRYLGRYIAPRRWYSGRRSVPKSVTP
jgi:glycosyltransferase involved in cell wall biosynthesis